MLLTGLLSLFSYRTQKHQPRDGTTHNGVGPFTSITNLENALQAGLQPDLIEAFSQLRLPPLYDDSRLCKADIKLARPGGEGREG